MSPADVPVGVWPALVAVLGAVFRVGYVVGRNNRRASRIYEDLADWARDDARREAKASKALLEELNADNLFYSGHRIVRENELGDEYAERWRNRKRQAQRDIEDLRDSENRLHHAWRRLPGRDWPDNPHVAEVAQLTQGWEERLEKGLGSEPNGDALSTAQPT